MTIRVGDTIQEYSIVDRIGAGHFGEVFEVRQQLLDEIRAMKFLPAQNGAQADAAVREIEAIRAFKHPSIIEINDARVFQNDGRLYVAFSMPRLSGSLEDRAQSGDLYISELINFMSQILSGLSAVHNAQYIHRDVKPANILINGQSAYLSDFGLTMNAASPGSGALEVYITHLAPENVAGSHQTSASDIYASGITLFRLLNGYFDFFQVLVDCNIQGPSDLRKISKKVPFQKWVPKKIATIVRKAIKPDPNDRYATAEAFQRKLESIKINIDWQLSYGHTWQGRCGQDRFVATIEKHRKFHVVFTKNGRKQHNRCKVLDDLEAAQETNWKNVAETAVA